MKIFSYDTNGMKKNVGFESFTFAGGEEHIRIESEWLLEATKVEIVERLTSSAKLMRLMLSVDAIRRLTHNKLEIELVTPYFPYARQDRVCYPGEALSASVMAGLINNLNFAKVTIFDAHSDLVPALLNNVENISQTTLVNQCEELVQQLSRGELTLVAPDAGAAKKTQKLAEAFGGEPQVIQAHKVRNPKTGDIVATELQGQVKGKKVLIADDICDGGRTFIELAKVLKSEGAAEISLFVTHGIFSKGLDAFEGLIDNIYTTDSFRAAGDFENNSNVCLTIIEM